MKRALFILTLILGLTLPLIAQEYDEETPVETLILKKGNIPAPVIKSAEKLFEGNTQVAWGAFPYELKDYGWSANIDYNEPIDHYEIQFKAKDGSDIYAIFESTGELIKCRIINRDAVVPEKIRISLAEGQYKDWKITGDIMQLKSNQKRTAEHYTVKVEKDNMTKSLDFSPEGTLLSVK